MTTATDETIAPETAAEYDQEFIVWGTYGNEVLGARPFAMSEESLRELYDLHSQHPSMTGDCVVKSFERWAQWIVSNSRHATDVVTLPDKKHIGFMYLTDVFANENEKQVVEAYAHFSFWEGKLGPGRRKLIGDCIEIIAKAYNIHRLCVRIPVYAAGAIRAASKLGFRGGYVTRIGRKNILVEGVLRKAAKFEGKWHDVVIMSRVEKELWAEQHQS